MYMQGGILSLKTVSVMKPGSAAAGRMSRGKGQTSVILRNNAMTGLPGKMEKYKYRNRSDWLKNKKRQLPLTQMTVPF